MAAGRKPLRERVVHGHLVCMDIDDRTPVHPHLAPFWVDTASGSRYLIDLPQGRWARVIHDPRSNAVRTDGGPLLRLGTMPRLGEPLILVGPSLTLSGAYRFIVTTPLVAVHVIEPAEPPVPAPGWWDD